MKIQLLNTKWILEYENKKWGETDVPCSMYSVLLENQGMNDPFYRENEQEACALSEKDCSFTTHFHLTEEMRHAKQPTICFEAIDTIATVYLNGHKLGDANNMYRKWEYNVTGLLEEENELRVEIKSPIVYMEESYNKREIWGVKSTIPGYQYIRKAHYMSGWDWGPKLPDMGIYRNVYLYDANEPKIKDFKCVQQIDEHNAKVTIKVELDGNFMKEIETTITITAPDGRNYNLKKAVTKEVEFEIMIEEPQLWWANGYGKANLYDLVITLSSENGEELHKLEKKIGLRTMELSREDDEWGQEFCFKLNGEKIFAMGSDYIPEDQIIPRLTKKKTRHLLEQCVKANYNCIRVWGGGYYPEDWFYDICDELGLIVWQDFMYACALYRLTDDFEENIKVEAIENIKRFRNHPSIGLWCGNNEMDVAWESWGLTKDQDLIDDYAKMFEIILPNLVHEYDGITPYWKSSPYSGNEKIPANDFNYGDVHYWDVWHGLKPMSDALNHYFRFCSEYGFESLPSIKTLDAVLIPEDYNLYSPAMENHQKCEDGNIKLMFYLGEYLRNPVGFKQLIYATQLLQAEAIRTNVEHMRRNRGRCMGSVYWQLNDSNPVISWSSIDYFNRWKALHYFCRRFYAHILLSAWENEKGKIKFNISNETFNEVKGIVKWALRNNDATIIIEGLGEVNIPRMSAKNILSIDISDRLSTIHQRRSCYLEYSLETEDGISNQSVIHFVPLKHYEFLKPEIKINITEDDTLFYIKLNADNYAKDVCLELKEYDCVFSDNWFDIHGNRPVSITIDKDTLTRKCGKEELMEQITVMSAYDIGKEK
jgi:beta-mannosidase